MCVIACVVIYRHNVEAEDRCYVFQCSRIVGEHDKVDCMHAADEGLCGQNILQQLLINLLYNYIRVGGLRRLEVCV